jgi:hypothetical protein
MGFGHRLLFDKRDHALLAIVNGVLDKNGSRPFLHQAFYPYFHPNGIKEMAESPGLRVAHAVVRLLDSLEAGKMEERLKALATLRQEVLDTARGSMPKNTARVLMQIMKDLVRAHGDEDRQLELAHDFRMAASGKPRVVRAMLRGHHLLEMPEEWNQAAFDDHVHDAYTKGRKSSTHLIMDAWIKGIRRLRVIYYNHVTPKVVAELVEAAHIMGIDIRVGVEFPALHRGRHVHLIWVPRGFADLQAFLCFLAEDATAGIMAKGREVSQYQQNQVLCVFHSFNANTLPEIAGRFGLEVPPLSEAAFRAFVGEGQMSLVHLGEHIHAHLLPALRKRTLELREQWKTADAKGREEAGALVSEMNALVPEAIEESWLAPLAKTGAVCDGGPPPEFLTLPPKEIAKRLDALRPAYRLTLNLSNVTVEDALEILYDCEGTVTRLEIFNLKDHAQGKTDHIPPIRELQNAINCRNAIRLGAVIRGIIARSGKAGGDPDQTEKLRSILHDMDSFRAMYAGKSIKSRVGSDSTGRSLHAHGMGLAILDTLPPRAQKEILREGGHGRLILPIHVEAYYRATYMPHHGASKIYNAMCRFARKIPGLRLAGHDAAHDWYVREDLTGIQGPGNIVTLGGLPVKRDNGLSLEPQANGGPKQTPLSWRYLDSRLRSVLKVLAGFIPAHLTFLLTKDWWVLAWFGALIWFAITGGRNIIQAVLGGGGIRRSPLLKWNDFVSWDRISDSLLFTGFSVPLLDFLVKTVLLDHGFGVTVHSNAGVLYAAMAVTNGLYIAGHNLYRGLPRAAAFGNLFRTVFSIPIALLLNEAAGDILTLAGAVHVDETLQKWAAVISKAASDTVAGVLEGWIDRHQNLLLRRKDYTRKFSQLVDTCTALALRFPEANLLEVLSGPGKYVRTHDDEVRDLEKVLVINALDWLYFWNYQPRATTAMRAMLEEFTFEERQIFFAAQLILLRKREISQLFLDGIAGENFARPLAFYLNRHEEYLAEVELLAGGQEG